MQKYLDVYIHPNRISDAKAILWRNYIVVVLAMSADMTARVERKMVGLGWHGDTSKPMTTVEADVMPSSRPRQGHLQSPSIHCLVSIRILSIGFIAGLQSAFSLPLLDALQMQVDCNF
jgi:hypothetical protein